MKNDKPFDKELYLGLKCESENGVADINDAMALKIVLTNLQTDPQHYSKLVKAGTEVPDGGNIPHGGNMVALAPTSAKVPDPTDVTMDRKVISQSTGAVRPNSVNLDKGTPSDKVEAGKIVLKPTKALDDRNLQKWRRYTAVTPDECEANAVTHFLGGNTDVSL